MSYNKCPYDLDIELWQLVCDEIAFKDQNYLLSCDRNLWYLLILNKLPQKYGEHMMDNILKSDKRYHNFRATNFNWNKKITDEGLKHLASSNRNITTINLSGCDKITDEGLKHLASSNRNITTIDLSYSYKISDKGLKQLSSSNRNITTINLSYCNKITDEGLKFLSNSNRNLTTINLSCCHNITDKVVII